MQIHQNPETSSKLDPQEPSGRAFRVGAQNVPRPIETAASSNGSAQNATARVAPKPDAKAQEKDKDDAPVIKTTQGDATTRTHIKVEADGDPVLVEVLDPRSGKYVELGSARSGESFSVFLDTDVTPQIRVTNTRTKKRTVLDGEMVGSFTTGRTDGIMNVPSGDDDTVLTFTYQLSPRGRKTPSDPRHARREEIRAELKKQGIDPETVADGNPLVEEFHKLGREIQDDEQKLQRQKYAHERRQEISAFLIARGVDPENLAGRPEDLSAENKGLFEEYHSLGRELQDPTKQTPGQVRDRQSAIETRRTEIEAYLKQKYPDKADPINAPEVIEKEKALIDEFHDLGREWNALGPTLNPSLAIRRYLDNDPIPGKGATISQLVLAEMMDDFKDAPPGSKERKFFDLTHAMQLLTNGYNDPNTLGEPITPEAMGENVINREEVEKQLAELVADPEFAESYRKKYSEKLEKVVGENFIVIDGKITLFDPSNPDHTTVENHRKRVAVARGVFRYETTQVQGTEPRHPRATPEQLGAALLEGVVTPENIDAYRKMTPEEQQKFMAEKFGPLAGLLPPEKFNEALAKFGASAAIKSVLDTDLSDIPDDAYVKGVELAGLALNSQRGPLNLLGHISSLTGEQRLLVVNTFKRMAGKGLNPADFQAFMAELPAEERGGILGKTMKELGDNGLFKVFASSAAVIGASIQYSFEGAARERLMKGDPREVMTLTLHLNFVASYANGLLRGSAKLLETFGSESAGEFFKNYTAFPDAGQMIGSSLSRFQPSFDLLSDALKGVDLGDEAAVASALGELDPAQKRKLFKGFGYDYKTLAKNISAHYQSFVTPSGPAAGSSTGGRASAESNLNLRYGVGSAEITDGNNIKAFVLDAIGFESDLPLVTRANNLLRTATPEELVTTDAVTAFLTEQGFTPEEIDKVIGYALAGGVDAGPAAPADAPSASPKGSDAPSTSPKASSPRNPIDQLRQHLGIDEASYPTPTNTIGDVLSEGLERSIAQAGPTNVPSPFKARPIIPTGMIVKGLSSGLDAAGFAVSAGVGIWDIVRGAKENDKPLIASGALGIASGVAGTLGGLASFGMMAGAFATPLFVVAGVLGMVSMIVSLASGGRPAPYKFSDALLKQLRPYGVLKDGSGTYVRERFTDHQKTKNVGGLMGPASS